MPTNEYQFYDRWLIPARIEDVYDTIADAGRITEWWRGVYLSAERLADGPDGPRYKSRVRGALPYELDFVVESFLAERPRVVGVHTRGDFEGRWVAHLTEDAGGTRVLIDWSVRVEQPFVKLFSPLLAPIFRWNHEWSAARGEWGVTADLAARGKLLPGAAVPEHPDSRPAPLGRYLKAVGVAAGIVAAAGLLGRARSARA